MPVSNPSILRVICAGALLLLVVHGLGRFIFTPLMPQLVADGQLLVSQAANLASWNYLGYLLGALLAMRWSNLDKLRRAIPAALALHCLTLLLLSLTDTVSVIAALRLLNGISNGLVFVLVPALVMEWLVDRGKVRASGLIYLGVGSGLLLSSALVSLSAPWLSHAQRWWPAALLSLPLAWWSWQVLATLHITHGSSDTTSSLPARQALFDRHSLPLFYAYAGAGLGYILPMTFLPMLASLQLGSDDAMVSHSWLIVSLAALPSTWLWNHLGSRFGDRNMLLLNYALQLSGVLAALMLPATLGLALCSLLIGSSFLGAVLLTQRLARALQPGQGPRLSAALIALYGLTQLAAPWLSQFWLARNGALADTLWLGAAALFFSLLCMAWVKDLRH